MSKAGRRSRATAAPRSWSSEAAMNDGAAANRIDRRGSIAIVAIGLAVAVAIGLAARLSAWPVAPLDRAFVDALVRFAPAAPPSRAAIVVDVDEVSLSAVGQWPWPRYKVAALIEKIAARHPSAIGLDVLFPEPDRASLNTIRRTFHDDFGVDVSFADVPEGLQDNDGYLGDAIARSGAVAASYLYFDHVNRANVKVRTGLTFSGRTDLLRLDDASGILVDVDDIAKQSRTTGFINSRPDVDGVVRRLPLLIAHDGVVHANLALATVMKSLGVVDGVVARDDDGLVLEVGAHRIPIDERGYALLKLRGPSRRYESVSAVEVLAGRVSPETFAGRVVFIGSTAAGLNDFYTTAVEVRFPGLKTHAAMAENILTDDFAKVPSWAADVVLAECLAVGLLMSAMFVVAGGAWSAVAGSLIVAAVLVALGAAPYLRQGQVVSPAAALLVEAVLFVLFFVARFAIEKRRAYRWFRQLENARQVTIESMASVAETRDPETGAHIKRTQHYVRAVAEELRRTGHFPDVLTKEYIRLLFLSAPLHDIGKVGVPDHILLKPGKLTPGELVLMRQHAEFGRKIIASTSKGIEGDNFLVIAGEIAATHHERWDGEGYPLGLVGDAIPLSGRIMATADIYDALISRRCYKEPFTHEAATAFMRERRGQIFDPVVLDAFFAIEDTIKAIAARYSDDAEEHPEPVGFHEHSGSLASA